MQRESIQHESMLPAIQSQDVVYSYPGTSVHALRQLNIAIPTGKKTAICGHNGSGKSTFFLQAIGIHRPDEGTMLRRGEALTYDRHSLKTLRQQVGLVFQDPEQQLILTTPREDISYGLRNAGVPEQQLQERTAQMLVTMGLEELADTPIHHLSLGQKKRVALAGVLVLEPEVVLLDEPTAYLDRRSEQQLIRELDRIHGQGITVVMATHDMNLAYAWADWILVMDRGQCVKEGTPYEVFNDEGQLQAMGLEMPIVLDIWNSLPERLRRDCTPPRDVNALKQWLQETDELAIHHHGV